METIIAVLAVYGITTLLIDSDGPFGIFWRLRKKFELFQCFLCLSVWVATIIALLQAHSVGEYLLLTASYSGAAIILYRIARD